MLIRMAWRNLWRNRRRTLLAMSSIAFAVVIAIVMRGFQLGTYESMIDGALRTTTGHVQIQHKAYFDDKSIDHIFDFSDDLQQRITGFDAVTGSLKRFENFALASFGSITKGVAVVGMDAEQERQGLGIDQQIIEGEYLVKGEPEVLLSKSVARYLRSNVGDSIVLFGQGYHGVTAVGKYRVKGIFDQVFTGQGNALVFLNLETARQLYGAEGKLTTLSLIVQNEKEAISIRKELNQYLEGSDKVALPWQKLNKRMLQSIEIDNVSGQIMIGILYLVIGFGIFGTLLMMAAERRREFSVMNSIGMQRKHIFRLVVIETFWLASLSVVLGMLISLPINYYVFLNPIEFTGETAELFAEFNQEPVMRMSTSVGYIYNQGLVVLVLSMLSLGAPLSLIYRLNIVNALRGR